LAFSGYKAREDERARRGGKSQEREKRKNCGKKTGEKQGRKKKEKPRMVENKKSQNRGGRLYRGEQNFCPCFFSKKQRRSCLTDREARTREERPFSGFISQRRPQRRKRN